MNRQLSVSLLWLASLLVLSSINSRTAASKTDGAQLVFETPGRLVAKGSDPQLGVRASGELFLLSLKDGNIWLQTSGDGGDSFEPGVKVNDVSGVASHSENTPQMIVRTMREFYVLWTADDGGERTALRLSSSVNWGRSFGKSVPVDPAGTASQSFYTLAVGPDGAVYAAWLDGRERGQGRSGSAAVYLAKSTNRGQSFGKSVRVALDVCPCCRPSLAFSDAQTLHLGWRGVRDSDMRDIFVATSTDGGATFGTGTLVAPDNWQLNGCPHSGPSLATLNGRLYVAWRTVTDNRPQLFLASSPDHGAHFSTKVAAAANLVDANHPRLVQIEDKLGLVFQARPVGKAKAQAKQESWNKLDVYFRQLDKTGVLAPAQRISHASGSATYPTLLYERPDHLFIAWTEGTEEGRKIVLSRGRIHHTEPATTAKPGNSKANAVAGKRGSND